MFANPVAAFAAGLVVGAMVILWWALRVRAQWEAMSERALRAASHEVAAEHARRQALAHRLSAVERLVGEALVYIEADNTVLGASPAAAKWFGLAALGLPGRRPPTTMIALRSAELTALVAEAADGATEPQRVSFGERLLSARAAPLPDGGVVLAIRDITEVERLARSRRDLVANVSHDLRTPLTSIGLMVEALEDGALNDAGLAATLLARIGEQLETLNEMVQAMLDLDRIESGHAVFRLQPVRLLGAVAEAIAALGPQIAQHDTEIELHVPEDLWVLADANYLRRALTNLLDNAVRFSPANGRVRVTGMIGGEPADSMAVVQVVDDGPGIPPGDLQRVFERFYRSERSRAGMGFGLGLAISRHIVEGHGGHIKASNRPGHGAIIQFTLSLAEPPPDPDGGRVATAGNWH